MSAQSGTAAYRAPVGAQVSLAEAARLWIEEGGDPDYAVVMARIAQRESGGDPTAQNLKFPDHSIGLWQINQLAHSGRYGSDAQLKDPRANARAAVAIFNSAKKAWGQPLKPWSTYNAAIDNQYIGKDAPIGATVGGAAGSITSGLDDAGRATQNLLPFRDILELLVAVWRTLTDPATWLRALMLIGGLVVGVFALKQLTTAGQGA